MYVMSPFTSLLVLENEAMNKQFKVDRGRKDHWALYPCPPKNPVVYEPNGKPISRTVSTQTRAKTVEDLLKTVLVRIPPTMVRAANGVNYVAQGVNIMQLYTGAIAAPVQSPQYWNYWGRMSQSGTVGAPTNWFDDFGLMPQTGPGMGGFGGGGFSEEWSAIPHFGNFWMEGNFDGTTNQLFGEIPVDGTAIWKGRVTWDAQGMSGGFMPLGGQGNPQWGQTAIPGISNINGQSGPFYPSLAGSRIRGNVNRLFTSTEFNDLRIIPLRVRIRPQVDWVVDSRSMSFTANQGRYGFGIGGPVGYEAYSRVYWIAITLDLSWP
jgi:hypothetical protein